MSYYQKIISEKSIVPMTTAKYRSNAIYAIKGMAIIGVVFHHILNRRLDPQALGVLWNLKEAFSWCVLAFFSVSGHLHAIGEQKHRRPIYSFVESRVKRLLLPFLCLIIFYATIAQIIQAASPGAISSQMPAGFFEKIVSSVWPYGRPAVAEQLYFLPLLFLTSCVAHIVFSIFRPAGIALLCGACLAIGVIFFSHSPNTGFSPDVLTWGTFAYAAGFLIFQFRDHRALLPVMAVIALMMFALMGQAALARVFPVALLIAPIVVNVPEIPLLSKLGEASATVYAYHTPYVLQPMVILASRLKGPEWQIIGALIAAALAIAVTTVMFYRLRSTPLRKILM